MADAADVNADMRSFWNGAGGNIWVERQAHTDITLQPVTDALLAFASPHSGERVLDVGCGCGAVTIDFARVVGTAGATVGIDISGPMLAEGRRRAQAEGVFNVEWHQGDAATAELGPFDLIVSAFGTMFFGDPVSAFAHLRAEAATDGRLAMVCWAPLSENPWMEVPMDAVRAHIPPRPINAPNTPGMFAFADQGYATEILTAAGWAEPQFEKLIVNLDIAAGRGLDEAVAQSTLIGAVNSWLRPQPDEVKIAATASIRKALVEHVSGKSVSLPGACWMISSQAR